MAWFRKRDFVFENYGGTYQLRIRSAEDLAALDRLDEPFWVATSAPIEQLTSDPVLLGRVDLDHNGRIRSWEVREACRWLLHVLRDRTGITEQQDVLSLEALDTSHDEGRAIHEAAVRILRNLGQQDRDHLTLAQVRNSQAIFAKGNQNGDGVIPPGSINDADVKAFAEDIIATVGAADDVNGKPGVDHGHLDDFLEHARALLEWRRRCEVDADLEALFPFGESTAERYAAYEALAEPINLFFQQCRIMALNAILDRDFQEAPCPPEVFVSAQTTEEYLAGAPLAKPNAAGTLPLNEQANPHYRERLVELLDTVIRPRLGPSWAGSELRESEWRVVKQAFAPYQEWLAAKAGGQVEVLGPEKLEAYLAGDLPQRLRALIDADVAAGADLAALNDIEYLILLQRWFLDLCNNFVSFPYLYEPERRAMFEAGRLVMDGHIFNLNLRVSDVNAHSALSPRSGIYLLYLEVTGGGGHEPFYIVTPVTRGRVRTVGVGKRGVLFDAREHEYDARVIKVVENPVSMAEAIAGPFRRIGALVTSTAERISTGAEQQLQAQVTQTSTALETGAKEVIASAPPVPTSPTPPPPQSPAVPSPAPATPSTGRLRDMMLTGGVAVAALGSSFAYMTKTLAGINKWYLLYAVLVGLAIVLIPTVLIAHFRLRRRNLSALLEASGWAVNAPMRLTRRLNRLIVRKPAHPKSFLKLRKDLTRTFSRALRRKHE